MHVIIREIHIQVVLDWLRSNPSTLCFHRPTLIFSTLFYNKNSVKYKKVLPHIFFAVLVGVFVFLNNSGLKQDKVAQPSPTSNQVSAVKEQAEVLRVIDGDTIEVSLNNKKETVRLIGIDAPEIVDPREAVECFGKEALDKAREILDGKTVSLESDPTQGERDKYGRVLRYVFVDDLNFNKLMISEGFAHEYTYQSNPYKYQLEFKSAQKQARESKVGLWADNVCLPKL